MNKITTAIIALFLPTTLYADRYGIYEDYEEYSYGGGRGFGDFFNYLLIFAASIAAWVYLFSSFKDWKKRKQKNEKPLPMDNVSDWIFTLIGYMVVAFLISFPLLLVMKWIGNGPVVKENWYWILGPSILIITFLRRT